MKIAIFKVIIYPKKHKVWVGKKLYRFGIGRESTDKMLKQVMKKVAQEARESSKKLQILILNRCVKILQT